MKTLFVMILTSGMGVMASSAAEVLLTEGFEGDPHRTFRLSHSNGGDVSDIQVHHFGVTDQTAAGGKRSFKIDISVNSGDDVHCTIPVDFPFTPTRDLKVKADLRVEGATAALGFYYRIPAVRLSDLVHRGKPIEDGQGWQSCLAQEPRLHKSSLPMQMHVLAVTMRPLPGTEPSRFVNARVVVHVDDLTVTAISRPAPRKAQTPDTPDVVDGYRIYPVRAITNEKILPSSPGIPEAMKLEGLELTTAQDEYESASFAILADRTLEEVRITMPPFAKGRDTLPAIDMRVVKCWYQPHLDDDQFGPIVPTLTSELLLHDDGLVTVDVKSITQHLKATTPKGSEQSFDIIGPNPALTPEHLVEDAPSLLPVTIQRMEPKQFWLTVHVPPGTPPGKYTSTLRVAPKNAPPRTLPVTLNVLPFQLPPPSPDQSIYYNAQLKSDPTPTISADRKTAQQLAAEFRDMKAHGVINPNVRDTENLEAYLTIRNRAGLSRERLFFMHSPHSSTNEQLRQKMAMFRRLGFKDVYLAGIDEATGPRLLDQRHDWERAHRLGFKMFVACYDKNFHGSGNPGFFSLVGDILDAPVVAGPALPELAAKVRAQGFRMYMYANPQNGEPNPETYRQNYGFALWRAGYAGPMNYAYQHGCDDVGHMWNDMALGIRDRMTYPTTSGVVVTMAWEGFREAVDDVRYVTLLQSLLEAARTNAATADQAAEIEKWLDDLDFTGDLHVVRRELCERILALMQVSGPDSAKR